MKPPKKTDVVIVGGGHAGLEASNIISKLGIKNTLITMDLSAIGRMSCNPAIGGVAKGQMVREFEEAVWSTPLKTVSAPVKTQFGYHLIWVHEREE